VGQEQDSATGALLSRRRGHVHDAFVVDEHGDFVIGKAPTTPQDIFDGLFAAIENAFDAGDIERRQGFSELKIIGYGATTVLNALLTRRGEKTGLIVTAASSNLLLIEPRQADLDGIRSTRSNSLPYS